MTAKLTLLQNGLDAIRAGAEDAEAASPHRTGTAVRSLYTGILLLLKEKLHRLGGDALVAARLEPRQVSGGIVWVQSGKNTVDQGQIEKYFKSLNLEYDFKRLKRLQGIRNDVEHKAPLVAPEQMLEVVADSLILIKQALVDLLDEVPSDHLGDAWGWMLDQQEMADELLLHCRATHDALAEVPAVTERYLGGLECPECRSQFVQVAHGGEFLEAELSCLACGAASQMLVALGSTVQNEHAIETYSAMKDGDNPPVAQCPACYEETFVVADGQCAACGDEPGHQTCLRCGGSLEIWEAYEDMCDYCSHVMSKAMRE